MLAATITPPCTNTVDRLSATTLSTVRMLIFIGTRITIVQCNLTNRIHAAAFILMISLSIHTIAICAPRAHAVNWLRTLLSSAVLKVIVVGAGIPIMSSIYRNLIKSTPLVLVCFRVMEALCILSL